MLSGKQRSYLKSLANTLKPTILIGKSGITENVIAQISDELTANELVKISLLENSALEAEEIVDDLLAELSAEFVSQLGNKLVIYRPSPKKKKIELPL